MKYKNIIENKHSVRDYKKTTVKTSDLTILKSYAAECKKLIPSLNVQIEIFDKERVFDKINGLAGYNGILLDAPNYIFIVSESNEHYIENAGYIGEELSLKATEIGLGSCWVTFKDGDEILKRLNIVTDKKLAAILAIGYEDKNANKTVVSNAKAGGNYSKADVKIVEAGSRNSIPTEDLVYIDTWENTISAQELEERGMLDAFKYATMAPSTLNRQPWRFLLNNGIAVLVVRDDKDTDEYEEKIDAGIVMLYFEAVMEESMFKPVWKLEKPEQSFNIPENFNIIGYCNI